MWAGGLGQRHDREVGEVLLHRVESLLRVRRIREVRDEKIHAVVAE